MPEREKRHRIPPRTTKRARQLRNNSTWPERRLWQLLRKNQVGGLKFRRQAVIGEYIVDFCCPQHRLIVELDGESHVGRGQADASRLSAIEAEGFRFVRVTNDNVLRAPDAVLVVIMRAAGLPVDECRILPTP